MAHPPSKPAELHREALRLMQANRWREALAHIDLVLAAQPGIAVLHINRAQCLMALGRRTEACEAAAAAQSRAPSDAVVADAAGSIYSFSGDQRRALRAYERAVTLAPDNAQFMFNRATVRRFLGQLEAAEADYDRVIALRPGDFEAYKNRSDLRTQSADRNHIAELEGIVARGFSNWRAEVQIRYSLAKEHEDLGRYSASFAHLELGAAKRREHLRYDVANDVATVDWIMNAFPTSAPTPSAPSAPIAAIAPSRPPAAIAPSLSHEPPALGAPLLRGAPPSAGTTDAPIFIVGLPRSGTTLVDRILGSHTQIESAGELSDFAWALVEAVRQSSGGAQPTRQELVARSAHLDFTALGRDYLRRARTVVAGGRFTDKMPLNYLYCGLIHRALPHARIVHLTRHPMAAGYAMYKTLFKDGYPFSYDLQDIGRYYIAYRRLMDHWRATMPGVIHEVNYEALVSDQERETRKLLEFCGLEWQEACLEFQHNSAATTTASASQIRRPLYDSSVAQWRHYSTQLAPLRAALETAGIEL
jgi:tetratricopeptide (TPR) repeat protein